jgi:hypothetical protein
LESGTPELHAALSGHTPLLRADWIAPLQRCIEAHNNGEPPSALESILSAAPAPPLERVRTQLQREFDALGWRAARVVTQRVVQQEKGWSKESKAQETLWDFEQVQSTALP